MTQTYLPESVFRDREYRKAIYSYIIKIVRNPQDAEDLTQDTFLRAFKYRDKYLPMPGATPRAWLYKIAHNTTANHLRKMKRLPTEGPDFFDSIASNEDIHRDIINGELVEIIASRINRLPTVFRSSTSMFFLEDRTYDQIAEIENIPAGTVKSRVHRGKESIKKELSQFVDCH